MSRVWKVERLPDLKALECQRCVDYWLLQDYYVIRFSICEKAKISLARSIDSNAKIRGGSLESLNI